MIIPGELIIELGVPTRNGNVYEAANFANLEETYHLVKTAPHPDSIPSRMLHIAKEDIIGEVTNVRIDNTKILADVKCRTSFIKQFQTPIQLTPVCMGILVPEGDYKKVTELRLNYFALDYTNKFIEVDNGISS